jgi:thymidylate kinase
VPVSRADRPRAPWEGTVALIGQDGSGKSSITRSVVDQLPFGAETMYMGINLEVSPVMLPTTRLALAFKRRRGRRQDMTPHVKGNGRGGGLITDIRRLLRATNWIAEEVYRTMLIRRARRRVGFVILDRDFYCDYYWAAVAPSRERRPIDVRLHGAYLRRWYPVPDLVLLLDAPPDVLHARRPEHDVAEATERRERYLALTSVLPDMQVVPADRPLAEVADDVKRRIIDFVDANATNRRIRSIESVSA